MEVFTGSTGCFESHESLFLKTSIPGYGSLNLWGIYRPPGRSLPVFHETLENLLSVTCDTPTVVAGDFNINVLQPVSSNVARNFVDLMHSNGFRNEINLPTYNASGSKSCIDHIWQNTCSNTSSYVVGPNLSDINFIVSILDIGLRDSPVTFKFRDFSQKNKAKFADNMQNEFFQCVLPAGDINRCAEYVLTFYTGSKISIFLLSTGPWDKSV